MIETMNTSRRGVNRKGKKQKKKKIGKGGSMESNAFLCFLVI